MWKEVKRIIQKHDHFLITTHQNPDGDGVGAAAALIELLLLLDKQVQFLCDSPIPERFDFLDFHNLHHVYQEEETKEEAQVLFVLDTHRLDRIGKLAALVDKSNMISICIDHHVCHNPFTPWTFIDTEACSVGAMIYTLFKESGYDLNKNAATGIYASIISDTGRFSFASTSRKAHKLADECLRLGVDPSQMHTNLYQQFSIEQATLFAKALQRMESYYNNRLIVQKILKEDYQTQGEAFQDLEYFHEFNKSVREVECTVVLCETPSGDVRISVRSKNYLDVEKPMRKLGGGGHSKAAGASWRGSILEAEKLVLDLLAEGFISHSVELAPLRKKAI